MILGGDIGGTHTRLALFDLARPSAPMQLEKFRSREYPDLKTVLIEYLKKHKIQIKKACFGAACAVHNGSCRATNLPWLLDSAELTALLKAPVTLINDLEANAYGVGALKPNEFFLLQPGTPQKGNEVLLSAGTGLGEAGFYWDGKTHHPFASEGGHADFAAQTDEELELFRFLHKENRHVSYERIVSGPGLYSLYRFFVETGRSPRCKAIESRDATQDPSRIISELGTAKSDPTCQRVIESFISFYGAAAGNVALHFLAVGGVYLGGGIAPHLLIKEQATRFTEAFIRKGRFEKMLQSIPIRVILNDLTALLGTAEYLRSH